MIYEVFDIDLNFYRLDLKIFIPVVGGLLGFIIFWFTQKSEKIKKKFLDRFGDDLGSARFIMFTKYLGGFSMGVLPAVIYMMVFPKTTLLTLGLGFYKETLGATVIWIIGLSALIIPMVRKSAKKPGNLVNYPQIRAKEWDKKMIVGNLAAWAFYLLGYEFLFRGLLLFPLAEEIGLWPAIAINIGLYSGTHIPKGLSETIGAIPLSIVLCLLSISTGTIWVAFFVHLAIAWTNTIVSFKNNPEMHYVPKRK